MHLGDIGLNSFCCSLRTSTCGVLVCFPKHALFPPLFASADCLDHAIDIYQGTGNDCLSILGALAKDWGGGIMAADVAATRLHAGSSPPSMD